MWDIFRLKLPVQLEKCGEREEWVERMRADADVRREEQRAQDRGGNPHTAEPGDPADTPHDGPAAPDLPKEIKKPAKKSEAPAVPKGAVIKGRAIAEQPVPIVELNEESGVVVIEGEVTNAPGLPRAQGRRNRAALLRPGGRYLHRLLQGVLQLP